MGLVTFDSDTVVVLAKVAKSSRSGNISPVFGSIFLLRMVRCLNKSLLKNLYGLASFFEVDCVVMRIQSVNRYINALMLFVV